MVPSKCYSGWRVSLVNGWRGLAGVGLKQLIPEISLGLPVDFAGYLSKLVFGDGREALTFEQQDVFLDRRGQKRHGQELVDTGVAHVEVAGELLDVVDLAAVQQLFDLVGKGKVLAKLGLVLHVLFLRGGQVLQLFDIQREFMPLRVILQHKTQDAALGAVIGLFEHRFGPRDLLQEGQSVPCFLAQRGFPAYLAQEAQGRFFDPPGADGPRWAVLPVPLHGVQAHVIEVLAVALLGVGVAHGHAAVLAAQQAAQKAQALCVPGDPALPPVSVQDLVCLPERFFGNDRLVEAGVNLSPVEDLAGVKPVLDRELDIRVLELDRARGLSFAEVGFRSEAPLIEDLGHHQKRLLPDIEVKNQPDKLRFLRVDHDPVVSFIQVIAQGRSSADPLALLLGSADLIPRSFADDLPLELREGQKDVQGQPPHGGVGIEMLSHRYERDFVIFEELQQLDEIQQRPGEPVHLIDHHAVDLARLDVLK